MGINSNLFMSHRWSPRDIKEVIERRFNTKVQVEMPLGNKDISYLNFTFSVEDKSNFLMHVHTDMERYGFRGVMVGLRYSAESVRILTTLAATFGGFFNEQDCDDIFEGFIAPDEGNQGWVLKEALKDNPKLGSDSKGMAEYTLTEGWRK